MPCVWSAASAGRRCIQQARCVHSFLADGRAVRLIRQKPASPADAGQWPATVPAVAQVLREDLDLPAGLTVLAGENGSGKSPITPT
jgi:hypothetical protein